ncbi:MAG: universal stress protein [Gammaproteobacteria bacterium]|nr:universal stress protein [Gammaproteobacteria bacterium]
MRVILVPVADRPECAKALSVAFDIGKRLGASVSGCHMRPHRYSEVSMSNAFSNAAWRKKCTNKAPAAAQALYRCAAEQRGYDLIRRAREKPGALWAERVGSPDVLMGIFGPVSDLIVVSRPARSRNVADMFMRAALLESSRPVLILPQTTRRRVGKRIVIAWNQSTEVARSVSAAMPLLVAATEVSIVSCGPEDHPGPKSTQVVAYLKHWGVNAEHFETRGRKIEPELMAAYKELEGDLIIAGAYSRSRWREKVFGGTTEFLLRKARIPVLTVHM